MHEQVPELEPESEPEPEPEVIQEHEIFCVDFMARILRSPGEGFYLVHRDKRVNKRVLYEIFRLVLFLLPVQRQVAYLPNPSKRFCLDMRNPDINFLNGKKMKRFLREFELSVSFDIAEDLRRCASYHTERGQSCWLTDDLVLDLNEASVSRSVPLYGFSLIEKATGIVAASTFGTYYDTNCPDFSLSGLI